MLSVILCLQFQFVFTDADYQLISWQQTLAMTQCVLPQQSQLNIRYATSVLGIQPEPPDPMISYSRLSTTPQPIFVNVRSD